MTFDIAKLCFTAPLHLSAGRQDAFDSSEDTLHSDTLKAALYVCARQLFDGLEARAFHDAFSLSSAMPFSGSRYFLPKPMVKLNVAIDGVEEGAPLNKKLKKLKHIEVPLYGEVLAGRELKVMDGQVKDGEYLLTDVPETEWEGVSTKGVQQRVRIMAPDEPNVPAPGTHDPVPYYVERTYFAIGAGLYVLVQWHDASVRPQVEAAFRLLGDEGVGTDRHVGNGQFQPEWGTIDIAAPSGTTHETTLGLFYPEPGAVQTVHLESSAYLPVLRGGYIAGGDDPAYRHYRKRSVYMFQPGSVFPAGALGTGQLVDLGPESDAVAHPVYRDGRTIFLPINANP